MGTSRFKEGYDERQNGECGVCECEGGKCVCRENVAVPFSLTSEAKSFQRASESI
jgi:hypothetical protein